MTTSDTDAERARFISCCQRIAAFALATLISVLILPSLFPEGTYRPWNPATIDLRVYRDAARTLLDGGNIIALRSGPNELAFLYPPIAAVLAVPLTWLPYTAVQIGWTAINVACLVYVLGRIAVPPRWQILSAVAAVLVVEPVRTTLGYGQVNLILLALVLGDLMPDGPRRRLIPRGVGLGFAVAVKLTPLLFVAYLVVTGRRRTALISTVSFAALTALGQLAAADASRSFWHGLLISHDTRAHGALTLGNQAITGFFARAVGEQPAVDIAALAVSAAVGLLGLVAAVRWRARGELAYAVVVVGMTSALVAPLAWSHHFVWVLPLAWELWRRRTALPPAVLWSGAGFVLWLVAGRYMALPAGLDQERGFTAMQDAFSVVTPLLGVAWLLVTLATSRDVRPVEPSAAGSGRRRVVD